jgi:hypothetical protein
MRPLAVVMLVSGALLGGGCSALSSPAAPPVTPTSATAASATSTSGAAPPAHPGPAPTHEVPTPHRRQTAPGSATAEQAIVAFTEAYVNWDAGSVSADMQGLAAASIGQARSAMELAAVQTANDYELRRGGIANHGSVEAVAPLRGQPGKYAVVTLESTSATATSAYQGLRPAWHVTVAEVTEIAHGQWVLSGWQPEG